MQIIRSGRIDDRVIDQGAAMASDGLYYWKLSGEDQQRAVEAAHGEEGDLAAEVIWGRLLSSRAPRVLQHVWHDLDNPMVGRAPEREGPGDIWEYSDPIAAILAAANHDVGVDPREICERAIALMDGVWKSADEAVRARMATTG